MNKKQTAVYKVKSLLAACEIVQDTPNARKYLEQHEQDTNTRFIHPSTLASRDLANSYSGDETPESVGVSNFYQSVSLFFEGCPRVSFPDSYTIKQIAELYYNEMRKKTVKELKQKIKDWEISSGELFYQDAASIH